MRFNHDNMTGPLLAADLVTLLGSEPPEGSGPSGYTEAWDSRRLSSVLASHEIRRRELAPGMVDDLRGWTEKLREAFVAEDNESVCVAVNRLLEEGVSRVFLTTHDQLRPHLHFADERDDVVDRVKAVTAGGLAIFIVESGGGRLGICGRDGCEVAFVDTSRNGSRSYCSPRCGNYMAVQRHRR